MFPTEMTTVEGLAEAAAPYVEWLIIPFGVALALALVGALVRIVSRIWGGASATAGAGVTTPAGGVAVNHPRGRAWSAKQGKRTKRGKAQGQLSAGSGQRALDAHVSREVVQLRQGRDGVYRAG